MRQMRYTCIIALLVWAGVSAFALPQTKQPSAWSTTYKTSKDLQPSYQFRSTSAYTSVVGEGNIFFTSKQEKNTPSIIGNIPYPSMAYASSGSKPLYSGPRRSPWDEDPTDDPVGAVPVGEPWILLIMAILYMVYKKAKTHLRVRFLFFYLHMCKICCIFAADLIWINRI